MEKQEPKQPKQPEFTETTTVPAWSEVSVGEINLKSNCVDFQTLVSHLVGLLSHESVLNYLRVLEQKKIKQSLTYVD